MGFPHGHCQDYVYVALTMRKGHDRATTWCQYDRGIVCQYDLAPLPNNYFLCCIYMVCQLTPWPLDNHKVATSISSVLHVVSSPHGYVVNTTCMSHPFWLDFVLIIKSKFTNLQSIMVNMQVIMSVTAIQRLATVLCYLLHLYVITSVTAIQWLATVL
jgi:hypothetical protein